MVSLDKILDLFSKLPKTEAEYKKDLLDAVENLTFTREDYVKERGNLIKLRKLCEYLIHLQGRRIELIETERKLREQARFVSKNPILQAEEIALLEEIEARHVARTTAKRGQRGIPKTKAQEKAYQQMLRLGYTPKEAKEIAGIEEEDD